MFTWHVSFSVDLVGFPVCSCYRTDHQNTHVHCRNIEWQKDKNCTLECSFWGIFQIYYTISRLASLILKTQNKQQQQQQEQEQQEQTEDTSFQEKQDGNGLQSRKLFRDYKNFPYNIRSPFQFRGAKESHNLREANQILAPPTRPSSRARTHARTHMLTVCPLGSTASVWHLEEKESRFYIWENIKCGLVITIFRSSVLRNETAN